MTLKHTLALCAAAASLGLAAQAAAAEGKFLHPADTDKDQKISKAEWAAFKDFAADQFDKADANKDGRVDRDEFVAWDAAGRGGTKPAG
jgi:hypothetical protein